MIELDRNFPGSASDSDNAARVIAALEREVGAERVFVRDQKRYDELCATRDNMSLPFSVRVAARDEAAAMLREATPA